MVREQLLRLWRKRSKNKKDNFEMRQQQKIFLGPMAVLEAERNKGIGRVLILKSLESMKELGMLMQLLDGPQKKQFLFMKNV